MLLDCGTVFLPFRGDCISQGGLGPPAAQWLRQIRLISCLCYVPTANCLGVSNLCHSPLGVSWGRLCLYASQVQEERNVKNRSPTVRVHLNIPDKSGATPNPKGTAEVQSYYVVGRWNIGNICGTALKMPTLYYINTGLGEVCKWKQKRKIKCIEEGGPSRE